MADEGEGATQPPPASPAEEGETAAAELAAPAQETETESAPAQESSAAPQQELSSESTPAPPDADAAAPPTPQTPSSSVASSTAPVPPQTPPSAAASVETAATSDQPKSSKSSAPKTGQNKPAAPAKPNQALPKIPRGGAGKKSTDSIAEDGSVHSMPSIYDLEWQHTVNATKAETSSKQGTKGFATAEGDAVDLGPMFAKRAKQDLRQVDQSVNIMEHNNNNSQFERDSLDSASQRSGRSAKSRTSVGRKSLVAPGRPHKFATRPSHVQIRRSDLITDESLIGVVEGRSGFQRSQQSRHKADVSNADAIDPSKKKQTALDRTRGLFVFLTKVFIVIGFIAYGVYLNLRFNEFAAAEKAGEATKTMSQFVDDGRSGEIKVEEMSPNNIDVITHNGDQVEVHMSHHPPSPAPPDLILGELASIVLRHEISLPEALNYDHEDAGGGTASTMMSPQRRALLWLAQSDALAIAEESRDIRFVRLLQRYSLAVFFYSVGGHYHPAAPRQVEQIVEHEVTRMEREVSNDDEREQRDYQGWQRKTKWMSDFSICDWYGIRCNDDDMVVSLNLTMNSLKGQLPMMELFQALRDSLKSFDVSHNQISGSLDLPTALSMKPWVQLEYFYVNDNQITGSPPFQWFDENPLLGINMARNLFSGELPNSGISNLEALKELYLSYNLLVGSLPRISNLPSLEILHLNNNLFVGSIPTEIFLLTSLVDLDVGTNSLTGSISIDLALMHNLEILSVENNAIGGHLPDRFNTLSNLKALNVSNNLFSGILPRSLSSVTDIESISLEQNKFSGIFPTSYAAMTKLESFLIQHNDLYGSIPTQFCHLKAGFFHLLKSLSRLEADCVREITCDCCDTCY
ncbi:LRR receptor-like serine threonine-protein kinase At4g08850-like [Seminavis robusta]|uniref:LRR receptor-like serine threonine-protein kinase At4g08850-like n=1 Tax=Seminavis robusta TaxID=568900 RepID=A0A9N8DQV9_9STRA|nr:LRR receptor-like serine threonine-protein kinase At4g08850-like [Seminavis robusta]|eukprot:Sro284_g107970.1 LRR receptor-like serine threonine-protein kinase At4g08850-like (859) ;mRNA; f:54357-57488